LKWNDRFKDHWIEFL